jgi:Cellulose biosynthesis protein BcsS
MQITNVPAARRRPLSCNLSSAITVTRTAIALHSSRSARDLALNSCRGRFGRVCKTHGALIFLFFLVTEIAAQAADLPVGVEQKSAGEHVIVSSSATANTLNAWSTDVSGTFAPFGTVLESGWRFRLTASTGGYTYNTSPTTRAFGIDIGGDFLAGYAFAADKFVLTILAGPSATSTFTSPENNFAPTQWSFKTAYSFYAAPTPATMIFSQGHYSWAFQKFTINADQEFSVLTNQQYAVQGKFGVVVPTLERIFVGPELRFAENAQQYREWQLGGHISGFNLSLIYFGFSAGYVKANNGRSGAYGGGNFYLTF